MTSSYGNHDRRPLIMAGSPPTDAHLVPHDDWDRPPWNRYTFQHVREFTATAEVWRGRGPASVLPERRQDLDRLGFQHPDGSHTTIERMLDATYTDGFLVLHRGAIVLERYCNGMTERTLHLSQSVAKSVTATVAGVLIGRGLLDPQAPVTDYLPELAATAYAGARLQHVLDMTSGVRFSEEYTDPHSDVGQMDVASGWKRVPADSPTGLRWPRHIFEQILGLTTLEAEHGSRFAYRSIETDVLAFCMERASGRRLPQLIAEELWAPMGAEESACFTVDPAGYALASGGFNATLRDFGRFGLVHLGLGLFGGRQIVPAEWILDTRRGAHGMFNDYGRTTLPNGLYRNQFWVEDARRETVMARGVFGQLVYVDPHHELVVVKLSSYPDFINAAHTLVTLAGVRAIGAALSIPIA